MLRTTDKENLDNLTNHIEVLRFRGPDENADSHLTALQQSIAEKSVIFIHYHSGGKEELSERMVEPVGLWYYSMYWHLIGWCRLRKGYRDFRVSRIQRLQLKDERFDASVHPTLHGYIESMKKDKSELNEVVVTMQSEFIRYIRESRYYYGFVKDEPAGGKLYPHVFHDRTYGLFRALAAHFHQCSKSGITTVTERGHDFVLKTTSSALRRLSSYF